MSTLTLVAACDDDADDDFLAEGTGGGGATGGAGGGGAHGSCPDEQPAPGSSCSGLLTCYYNTCTERGYLTKTQCSGGSWAGSPESCNDEPVPCDTCQEFRSEWGCAEQKAACDQNPECVALADCVALCNGKPNDACWNVCHATNPNGATDYDAFVQCTVCSCKSSCEAEYPGFCP